MNASRLLGCVGLIVGSFAYGAEVQDEAVARKFVHCAVEHIGLANMKEQIGSFSPKEVRKSHWIGDFYFSKAIELSSQEWAQSAYERDLTSYKKRLLEAGQDHFAEWLQREGKDIDACHNMLEQYPEYVEEMERRARMDGIL